MSTEYTGGGDPRRTIELLWGVPGPPRRGPKPKLTVAEVVTTAMRLADHDGLDAVTMRRVADELSVAPMSIYTYVPGRAELIDLMLDTAHGELTAELPDTGWRDAITAVAEDQWRLYHRHPWLLQITAGRPPLGPNTFAKYERELTALDELDLDDLELDAVVTLVTGFVHGAARGSVDAVRLVRRSGLTDAEWWARSAPVLGEIPRADAANFPRASRVGSAAGEAHNAASDPEHHFRFGLACILDGVEQLVERR
ncbi:TetR/AcrR family transcriptional regulator [Amycolatopsis sp. FDAARGOS 1241]|uniref:TetR/AcrR family transcriptional regulator n=1 Tax=Amycolatopsis sp. FDAARGOS 1241 TaxID=2778070 RepID=UPI00194F3B6B|nr:TetR/AcrR family transcriptional regulator [Amycolatopsis sp. FDAARGOS 1241]QRP49946.1 TetR/AcrR family transcriptional regulator C-terminal domain-containing protein [Amycolatopsis sp. FDAARGOS 1241]